MASVKVHAWIPHSDCQEKGENKILWLGDNRIHWRLGINTEGYKNSKEKGIQENGRTFLHPLRWHHPLNFTSVLELWDRQWLSQLGYCHQCRQWWERRRHIPPPENDSYQTLPHLRAFVLAFPVPRKLSPAFSQSCLILALLVTTQMSLQWGVLSWSILSPSLSPLAVCFHHDTYHYL